MKTVLQEFSTSFDTAIRPLLQPLEEATAAIAGGPAELPAQKLAPKLRELHHQIDSLVRKVAAQQAYVLIFGPLKSGKSTFMNALSGSYVSEVTSLPAYPCMVYVRHSDEPGFEVTHYDGRTTQLRQREALEEIMAAGHHDLTRRLREVEAEGESFDPAAHMPEAIRKIDVKVAIDDLVQSKAVLVDTPGLYTRMKFGYDRMTREFRDSAACAIFIVKTDNLFLEQVFDEFGELLELFSRIFLIVNVDSTKKDLLPDGTLAPSLEQKDPRAVIDAFEHLSMTSPLQQAVEEGRLRIYPIDLLQAASKRIRARSNDAEHGAEAADDGQSSDFGDMLEDLTEFLNSNEYLKAFIDDSLRRSRTLMDELDGALHHEAAIRLPTDVEQYERAQKLAQTKVETIESLQEVEWQERVQALTPDLMAGTTEAAARIETEARERLTAAVDTWFETPNSLEQLIDHELQPVFSESYSRLIREAEDTMRANASEDTAGLASGSHIERDLANVGVDLGATAASALANLKAFAAAPSPQYQLPRNIPVRRTFSDWLMLRSQDKVRRRLFGPAEQPSLEIEPARKQLMLGDEGRKAISEAAIAQLDSVLRQAAQEMPEQLVRGYAERFAEDMNRQLDAAFDQAKHDVAAGKQRLANVRTAHESVTMLATKLPAFSVTVDRLIGEFGQAEQAPVRYLT